MGRTGAGPGKAGRILNLLGVDGGDMEALTEHFDGDGSQRTPPHTPPLSSSPSQAEPSRARPSPPSSSWTPEPPPPGLASCSRNLEFLKRMSAGYARIVKLDEEKKQFSPAEDSPSHATLPSSPSQAEPSPARPSPPAAGLLNLLHQGWPPAAVRPLRNANDEPKILKFVPRTLPFNVNGEPRMLKFVLEKHGVTSRPTALDTAARCDRLWFDNNLSVIGNTRKESSRLNALRVLWNEFGRGGAGGDAIIAVSDDNPRLAPFKSYLVCASCRESLVSGRVPWVSVSLGYRYPPRPAHLHDLNAVEERLISPRLPFMSTRRLTRGNGQFGIKGQVVNVPIDVPSVVECLPRMVPEDLAFEVHIKRRLLSPATYKRGLVKRGNILAWLKHLEHTPLYRAINVRFEWSRLEHFDDGETDEGGEGEPKDDDGDIETIPDDFDVNDPLQLAIALNAVSKTMFFNEEGLRGVQREEEDASTPVKTRVVLAGATGSDAVCEEAETVRKLVDQSHSLHVAPGENRTPIALFLDEYAEEFAFPTIYLGMPRYITGLRPTPFLKASSEIRRTERRGATPEHVLYMAAKVMRYNVAETAMTFRTNAATDSITREQLEKGGKRFLDEMLDRDLGFLRGVPNTVQYWQDRRKDLFAMIRQLGKPHAFLTMSASEVHWERLLETLERLRVGPAGRARVIAEMMAWERVELVNNDPVTCAIYTNRIFDVIMNVLNDKRCSPFKPYVVRDYFKRVEFQQRARARHPGTHQHTHTCYKRGRTKCRFGAPFMPSASTEILVPFPPIADAAAGEDATTIRER
ncbi:uncharacterized protein LOC144175598 [Haemaphysalis longicornis]